MAELFGTMLAVYLMSKLVEWAVLARVIQYYDVMIVISTVLITGLSIFARIKNAERIGAELNPVWIVMLVVGGAILIVGRIVWHKRRLAKVNAESA